MPEPSDSSIQVAERLHRLGVESAATGTIATNLYCDVERMTNDVAFIVRTLDGVSDALEADGFEVETTDEPASVVSVRGGEVDVTLIAAETACQVEALERAVDGLLTVEDVVIDKLLAWRPRDRGDIRHVLAAGHELDHGYLDRWVAA